MAYRSNDPHSPSTSAAASASTTTSPTASATTATTAATSAATSASATAPAAASTSPDSSSSASASTWPPAPPAPATPALLSRHEANRINPLICERDTVGTLDRLGEMLDTLGSLMSGFTEERSRFHCTDLLFGVTAAAARYETLALIAERARQREKEQRASASARVSAHQPA